MSYQTLPDSNLIVSVHESKCKRVWYHIRTPIAIILQLTGIGFAIREFYNELSDSSTAGYLIMVHTVILGMLIFDLINRSDLLSQLFWISDFSNTSFLRDSPYDDPTDPAVIEERRGRLTRSMSYILLTRVVVGLVLSTLVDHRFSADIFCIISFYNYVYAFAWFELIIARGRCRSNRARDIRNERHDMQIRAIILSSRNQIV